MDHVRDLLDGCRGTILQSEGAALTAMRWTPPEELEER